MMSHAWPIVLRGGLLDPRGYPPLYALMIVSHRVLRYAAPFLHVVALAANLALLGAGGSTRALALQVALLAAARRRRRVRARPLLVARYYVLTHGVDRRGPVRTGCATARAAGWDAAGGHAVMPPRASTSLVGAVAGARRCVRAGRRCCAALAIRLESPGHPIYRQRRVGKDGREFDVSSCARWSAAPSTRRGPRGRRGRHAHHARRRAPAPHVDRRAAEPRQRAARRDVDHRPAADRAGPGRPVHRRASAGGWRSSPGITGWAQVNGRASLPWSERIELDLWYIEHRSLRARPRDPARGPRGMLVSRQGALQGRDGRLGGRRSDERRPADRRRQALRHRRGLRPARDRRSPATPTRWRPRSTRRPSARAVPLIGDPGYVPALQALCEEFDVGAVVPLTDLDIEVLAQARADGLLPALVPDPEIAPRDLRQVRDPPAAAAPRAARARRRCCRASRSRPTR